MLLYKTSWSVQVNSPIVENPSCLQTTVASILSQFTSHTVPHTPFKQISTLPSNSVWPPLNRTAPSVHATNRGELIFIVKLELGWLKNRVAVHHIKIKVHLRIIVTLVVASVKFKSITSDRRTILKESVSGDSGKLSSRVCMVVHCCETFGVKV